MKKSVSIILIASVIMTLFTGCSGANNSSKGNLENSSGGEKVIRITVSGTPVIDPAIGISNSSAVAFVNLYDTLVFPTQEGVIPWLAERWDVSEDGKEYKFYLKKGVKFHDGSELLASDVVFSARRLLDIGEGFAYIYSDIIKDVEATDNYTVKFILNSSSGTFVDSLCRLYILNEDMVMNNKQEGPYGEFGDYGKDYLITNDAGSGPYMAKELVQQDYFYAARFDDWHKGWEENSPDAFKMIDGTESATVRTMLANGQLEISDMWQSKESLEALDKLDGVDLVVYSTRLVQNVFYNTTIAPTDDVNYRKALSHLFDYNMIANNIFVGSKLNYGPVSSYTAGNVKTTQYNYNIEKAEEYLSKSKYAQNYGDYTLEFLVNSDVADLEKVALAFQSAARQVGITVEIKKVPWVTLQDRVSRPETTPNLVSINSAPQYNDAGATLESGFHSKTAGTYENCHWAISDEIDREIEDALATIDKEERFENYAVIQNKIVDEIVPEAWISDLAERVAYRSTYIEWPAATASKVGESYAYLMGYPFFFPDMKFIFE
ncbi:ABC transporter substrate-binding protein [Sedimentibacter sp.]|uniref:ABC transporter substrate-binding protein n=1 Tax=Sedimentibacter sp. TaxID=1960295 RepID=UPI0028AACD35|nr:ABC transporter substrate-binding protein [Sedimentibacter sp.]